MTLLASDSKQSPAPKLSWRVWEVSPGSWCWPHQSLWPCGHWGGLFYLAALLLLYYMVPCL